MTTTPDGPVTQDEEQPVNDVAESDDGDGYQPPLTGKEAREVAAEVTEYVKEAWLQPFRRVVRDGFDATREFARDLSGRQRRK